MDTIKIIFLFFCFPLFPLNAFSQDYGGSAFVKVMDSKGEIRYLNVVIPCREYSEADAKKSLLSEIKSLQREIRNGSEIVGRVNYFIDARLEDSPYEYGGSAYVEVKHPTTGKIQHVNVSIPCGSAGKGFAKMNLLRQIEREKEYYGVYVSEIHYDLSSCSR